MLIIKFGGKSPKNSRVWTLISHYDIWLINSAVLSHTFNLSFLLHGQDFRKPNFTPKKTTKDTKNTKNFSEKVKCMQFFHPIWKNLHLTEIFYTGTACDACDKYEVCSRNEYGHWPSQPIYVTTKNNYSGLCFCFYL